MKIVVLSPHRGDAAFSLGLSIDAWIKAGHRVQVLNCFSRSVHAPHAETEFVHSNDLLSFVTALRAREDEAWKKLCGNALSLKDLNMKDAARRLRMRADAVHGLAIDPEDKALAKIAKGIDESAADALVIPLALGGHIDHMLAREASLKKVATGMPCGFYEDLPEATADGRDIEAEARGVDAALAPVLVGDAGSVESAVKRKRKLAFCYDSQVDDGTVEAVAKFCVPYEGRERLWVNRAWMDSGL